MSAKYEKIMDHIVVTEEMRKRILQNVHGTNVHQNKKVIRFLHWQRYVAIAACFVVLLIGSITVPGILHQSQETSPVDVGGQGIAECQSAKELSKQLGFSISDIDSLPFEVTRTVYLSSWGEIGEIDYTGADGQTAVYRKSVGTDDNSGNYETFSNTQQVSAGTVSATIKGNGAQYTLAFWTDGRYAYSIVLSKGVSVDEWSTIIQGIS